MSPIHLDNKVSLIRAPSSIERLNNISRFLQREIYCKDDSGLSEIYGGTKVRKLEYILKDALDVGAKNLVTVGGWGSHHILATARHGAALDLKVHGVVLPQPVLPQVEWVLKRSLASGAHLYPVNNELAAFWKIRSLMRGLQKSGQAPYLVGLGGSSPAGILGTVQAALELTNQVRVNPSLKEATIYMALGSGSSVAGLALGLALLGYSGKIKAIQVTSGLVMNRFMLYRLLVAGAMLITKESANQKSLIAFAASMIDIDKTFLGRGYGWPTQEGSKAIEMAAQDGIQVDAIYTAKVFAAMCASKQRENVSLYWHTKALDFSEEGKNLALPHWYLNRP